VSLDRTKQQIFPLVSATDPSLTFTPVEGQFWWDSANKMLSVWDATAAGWSPILDDDIYLATVYK